MNSMTKVQRARSGMIFEHPFYASLALKLNLVEDPSCKTLWVDGVSLGFNPTYIDSLSIEEVKGVLAHEALHCGLQHHLRKGLRDHNTWNEAGDYVINYLLTKDGIQLPPNILYDGTFGSWSTEEVYQTLLDQKQREKNEAGSDAALGASSSDQKAQSSEREQQNNDSNSSNGEDTQENKDSKGSDSKTQNNGRGDQEPQQETNDQSSQSQDFGGTGEVRNHPGEASEQMSNAQEWTTALVQAAQVAKGRGMCPGWVQEVITSLTTPKMPWSEMLRQFLQKSKDDYSWRRPARRFIGNNLYLPSIHSESINIALAVDTSGSVSSKELQQFTAEVNQILQDFETVVITLIQCDTRINQIDVYEKSDLPLTITYKGRGGTRFEPPFEYVSENNIQPDCFVYLTDGEMWIDMPEPDYPVLWVTTNRTNFPWGEVCRMS
jgi:predicted metal-dependent peptidase